MKMIWCALCVGALLSAACAPGQGRSIIGIGITPSSVTLQDCAPGIVAGTQIQFHATGFFSDNTQSDVTTTVNWSSDNPLLSINQTGLATFNQQVSVGFNARIQAQDLVHKAATSVPVTVAPCAL